MAQRPRPLREQVAVARAQLRAMNRLVRALADSLRPVEGEPPRIIQCWAASRAGFVVTQALDASGQVWERRVKLGPEVAKGEERQIEAQWWEKVGMERRESGKGGA